MNGSLFNLVLASFLLFEVHTKFLQRITKGQTAKHGQNPYIVGLKLQAFQGYIWCSGIIISNNWILTTGQCTQRVHYIHIYYGSIKREAATDYKKIKVSKDNVIRHPQYNPTKHLINNLSLIRTGWVRFSDYIQSIRLPSPNQLNQTFVGKWARVVGWGKQSDCDPNLPDLLQWIDLKIIKNSQCIDFEGNKSVPKCVLCVATEIPKSTCCGDSGGPLILNSENILVGVTSFISIEGCQIDKPDGFVRVTEYLDWIRNVSGVSS